MMCFVNYLMKTLAYIMKLNLTSLIKTYINVYIKSGLH